jgi:pyruvate dehydrogenase (quinone)
VHNDSSLSLIRIKQRDRGQPRAAVDFGTVDAAALARALGADGTSVSDAPSAGAAVAEALQRPGPAVVEVAISGEEYAELERVIRTTGLRREPAWAD